MSHQIPAILEIVAGVSRYMPPPPPQKEPCRTHLVTPLSLCRGEVSLQKRLMLHGGVAVPLREFHWIFRGNLPVMTLGLWGTVGSLALAMKSFPKLNSKRDQCCNYNGYSFLRKLSSCNRNRLRGVRSSREFHVVLYL